MVEASKMEVTGHLFGLAIAKFEGRSLIPSKLLRKCGARWNSKHGLNQPFCLREFEPDF